MRGVIGTGSGRREVRPPGDVPYGSPAAAMALWVGFCVYLGLLALLGGSNLPSAVGLVLLRPAGIMLVAALLMTTLHASAASMRIPGLLLAAFTASIAVQLVPLPPAVWASLGGRSALADMFATIGEADRWRPLSLTPAITLSSLLSTLTGWVILLAFTRLPEARHRTLTGIVILIALASCVVGLLQLVGGSDSVFRLYKSDGSISGLLANRNHQATLLATTLPLLRIWAAGAPAGAQLRRGAMAVLLGVVILGMILLTGSRSGLVLGLIGTVAAYTIAPVSLNAIAAGGRHGARNAAMIRRTLRWGLLALPLLLVAVAIWAGRDLSIQRLFTADYASETRLRALPTTLSLVKIYLPFGSGFGSFDAVFRMYER